MPVETVDADVLATLEQQVLADLVARAGRIDEELTQHRQRLDRIERHLGLGPIE